MPNPAECIVAIHLGAGYHSLGSRPILKNIMNEVCLKAMSKLREGMEAIDACAFAISLLEVSLYL